jgi:calcium release-activated calcium channel protein 1
MAVAASSAPYLALRRAIELVWFLSFVLGMFLFLLEVAILSWVKYWDYSQGAAIAGCVVAVIGLFGLALFILHFHRQLAIHEDESVTWRVQQLERMREQLDIVNTS